MAPRGGSKQSTTLPDAGSHTPAGPSFEVLPPPYALALRLEAAGASVDELARRLRVGAEAVPLVLELAKRKLRRALGG